MKRLNKAERNLKKYLESVIDKKIITSLTDILSEIECDIFDNDEFVIKSYRPLQELKELDGEYELIKYENGWILHKRGDDVLQ